nr:hypothetical protein [Tanacetum cinerariifolium]
LKSYGFAHGNKKRLRRSFFKTTKATKSNSVVACRQRARVVDSFDCSKKKHKIYQDVSDTPESVCILSFIISVYML